MATAARNEPTQRGFITGYNEYSRSRYSARNADSCCAYLLPYLHKLPPDFTFLDVGCGPGSITVDLASRFPSARFTGIDPGELFVASAQSLAAGKGVTNVDFRVASIDDLAGAGVEKKSWDVVHCHQVLCHLPNALEAARTIKSLAKPAGGLVAAREAFFEGIKFYPPLEGIRDYLATTPAIFRANGSDPELGQRLLGLMLDVGWRREQVTFSAGLTCIADPETKSGWARSLKGIVGDQNTEWYQRALKVGCTQERLSRMGRDWEEWEARQDAWGSIVNGEAVCKNSE